MRKKYYYLFIVIIAFNLIFYPFFGVKAKETKEQREVCSWPSQTMGLYFQFQNEMMSAMLWSEISEKRFYSTKSDGGLFKERYLTLGTGSINALDILATSIRWNMQAAWSTITTLTVLLELAGLSVLQSNTEWLWILTKDRVIVREYKSLLDIETSLMELAYYLSQHVNLLASFDWNLLNNVKSVIEKYQELWLLEKTDNLNRLNWVTIADIMGDLVLMNGYMKHFILFNAWLDDFEPSLIPGFDTSAIKKLENDYGWLWAVWSCTHYQSNILSTWNKWQEYGLDSLKNSMNDVKLATKRLASAFTFSDWNKSSKDSNRCDMSEYEMAQLRAYRWWNWTCKTWVINGNVATTIQNLAWEKKAQEKQKEKTTKLSKEERKALKEQERQAKAEAKKKKEEEKKAKKQAKEEKEETKKQLKETFKTVNESTNNVNQKKEVWRELFWSGATFNVLWYSAWFNSWLVDIYLETNSNYSQSQQNAISSDLSYELVNIKALLNQVDDTSSKMDELKNTLKEIAKYQCKKSNIKF